MSFSPLATERLRGNTIASFAPFWEGLEEIKQWILYPFQLVSGNVGEDLRSKENQRLQLENRLLAEEVVRLQDLFQQEYLLYSQLTEFQSQTQAGLKADKHSEELKKLFQMQLDSVSARVIYRSPASWSSSLWINVGAENNQALEREVIGKNSPVVLGTAVVGIVDYVGKRQSRVRLITDSGLNPSVRVVRGVPKQRFVKQNIDSLIQLLSDRENYRHVVNELKQIREKEVEESPLYLAKGELRGGSLSLWRTQREVLFGQGFNYDFPDEKGPARDLRSGQPIAVHGGDPIPILKENDLLVTTGMDGVFPLA